MFLVIYYKKHNYLTFEKEKIMITKYRLAIDLVIYLLFIFFYAFIMEVYRYSKTVRYDWVYDIYIYSFPLFLVSFFIVSFLKHKKFWYMIFPFLICLLIVLVYVVVYGSVPVTPNNSFFFFIKELFIAIIFVYVILGFYILSLLLCIKEFFL